MHSEGVIEHRFSADGVDVHAQVARMEGAVPMITLRMPRLPKYGMRNMPVSERKVYRFNTEGDAMMQTESYSGGGMEIVASGRLTADGTSEGFSQRALHQAMSLVDSLQARLKSD